MSQIKVVELGRGESKDGKKVIFNDEGGAVVIRDAKPPHAQFLLSGSLESAEKMGYKLMEKAKTDTPGVGGKESLRRDAPADKNPSDHSSKPAAEAPGNPSDSQEDPKKKEEPEKDPKS